MSGVYDTDILVGPKTRRRCCAELAAGERVNDQVDWATSTRRSKAWA